MSDAFIVTHCCDVAAAMKRVADGLTRKIDGQEVAFGRYMVPPTPDWTGHLGSVGTWNRYLDCDPPSETYIRGMKNLHNIYDPMTFYWGAWDWSQNTWGRRDEGNQFWKIPDLDARQGKPPFSIPVLDVNDR